MSDRDLIARLAHALRVQLDGVNLYSALMAEADAHQGKPGGGAMSCDRLRELFDQHAELPGDGQPVQCLDLEAFEAAARALLAEAQPQPEPVSVAERLPTAQDCDAEGRCWLWAIHLSGWIYRSECVSLPGISHWLPHWALPVPLPTTEQ